MFVGTSLSESLLIAVVATSGREGFTNVAKALSDRVVKSINHVTCNKLTVVLAYNQVFDIGNTQ